MKKLILMVSLFFVASFRLNAQVISPPEVPVESYILIDAELGQVLAQKEANKPLAPASITKLMTAYLVFQALENGQINLTDEVIISQNAYSQKGSRMFVELKSSVPVSDLIQGMIVQSGNDASVALAEHIAGSEGGFIQLMNKKAKELGMKNSAFANVTGLPNDNHYMTAADIAILARAIINDFPQYYHFYSQKEFTWNKIKQPNRNKLLWRNPKIDGLKTGHTDTAGYCLAASEQRDDMRLVAVVLGAVKEEDRYDAIQALLNYGFSQYTKVTPLQENQVLQKVRVYKGAENEVEVIPLQKLTLLVPIAEKDKLRAVLQLNTPLVAPIAKNQQIGTIVIKVGDKDYAKLPAVSLNTVESAGFFGRNWDGLKLWWAN